jgi:hypothetical protein
MRESCKSGSVGEAAGDRRLYPTLPCPCVSALKWQWWASIVAFPRTRGDIVCSLNLTKWERLQGDQNGEAP